MLVYGSLCSSTEPVFGTLKQIHILPVFSTIIRILISLYDIEYCVRLYQIQRTYWSIFGFPRWRIDHHKFDEVLRAD